MLTEKLLEFCIKFVNVNRLLTQNYEIIKGHSKLVGRFLRDHNWAKHPDVDIDKMIAHLDKKRQALGIDKARDRILVDMAARRELETA